MKNALAQALFLISLCQVGCVRKPLRPVEVCYYEQSVEQAKRGNMPEALRVINQALAHTDAWYYQATKIHYLYHMHDFVQAAQVCEQLLARNDIPFAARCELMNNYACIVRHCGNKDQANAIWHKLINDKSYLTPEVAWFNLGLEAFHAADYQEARRFFTAALKRSPIYIDALFFTALTERALGCDEACVQMLKQVLTLMPHHQSAQQLIQTYS